MGTEPIELLNWTSVSSLDKILDRKDTFFWYAGFNYDVKSSFQWGVDGLAGMDTDGVLALNPYIDLYAYVSSYFDFHFPMGMIGVNVYMSPTQVHLLDIDLTLGQQTCWSASMSQAGVHFDVGLSFGWPSCEIGLLDTIFGEGLEAQGCEISYWGYVNGISPLFSFDTFDFLNQTFYLFEETCSESAEAVDTTTTDETTDSETIPEAQPGN